MSNDCPNCGHPLRYDRRLDEYICTSCGWSESVEEEQEMEDLDEDDE